MRFEFATAARIAFGCGALNSLGTLARGFGARALVVSGRSPARAERVRELLATAQVAATVFAVAAEPDIALVNAGVAAARRDGCDFVIGIGGGSALDAAKAIAALLANGGEILDYLEVVGRGAALTRRSAPCVAIPTTAGTGSEVTRNAVIASPEHRVKASLRSPLMLPRLAIVDPALTIDLPPAITASTGLDALTQVIEPYVSCTANPITDALSVDAIPRAATALRTAFHDGTRIDAREQMALASLFGGLALANAGLGAVHGFAGPIGGMFNAPHGAVCAALLPHVMAANVRALGARAPGHPVLRRFAHVAALLTGRADATPEAGADWVGALVDELGIPPLRAYGVTGADVDELVTKAMRASSMKGNPIELTAPELTRVLAAAI